MSFVGYKTEVELGDTVFVYLGPKNIYPILVSSGQVFQTKYGALRHDQLVGKQYGSVINCAKGFVHILHSTPELWTLTLPHRTQILYTTDCSFIVTQLDLKPGSVVCEAGTGSGSLSHSIARTIAPNGKLFTFDFHEERVTIANQEFQSHGLSHLIVGQHRDVCAQGFGFNNFFDSLFLDLPHPWIAIPSAKEALKSNGGRICCFSPCIEQVQKTCVALKESQFFDIDTYECLLRPYEVKPTSMPVYNFVSSKKDYREQDVSVSEPVEQLSKKIKTDSDLDKAEGTSKDENKDSDLKKDYITSYSLSQTAGHTGFITIAVKYE